MILEEKGLAAEEVHRMFCYTPTTGVVIHKIKKGGKTLAMTPAGSINGRGYLHTEVKGRRVLNHRLAWVLYYGFWPSGAIDHRDRDPLNNRIENLRVATQAENMQNVGMVSRNKSGVKGVSWDKGSGKWRAHIGVFGVSNCLGYFDNIEEAAVARRGAEVEAWGFKPPG